MRLRKFAGETKSDEDHANEKKFGWIKYTEINMGMEISLRCVGIDEKIVELY